MHLPSTPPLGSDMAGAASTQGGIETAPGTKSKMKVKDESGALPDDDLFVPKQRDAVKRFFPNRRLPIYRAFPREIGIPRGRG